MSLRWLRASPPLFTALLLVHCSPAASPAGATDASQDTAVLGTPDTGTGGDPLDASAGGGDAAPANDAAHPHDASGPSDAGAILHDAATAPSKDAGAVDGWVLTWADEFDGPDGSAPDPSKWGYDIGGSGWGNNELEYYTDSLTNAVVTAGELVITATPTGASANTCWNGACQYTSARINTSGKFAQQYGRFEARIKIPEGSGVWPAFWLLGENISTVSWPDCGEIDIMENIGGEPSKVHGTTHGPGPSSYVGPGLSGTFTSPDGGAMGGDFHVYAVTWSASSIAFDVDGTTYWTVTPSMLPAGATWVWDQPFFVILNFAVGGSWPGSPDGSTVWPQTMTVDYVRVYQPSP